MKNLVWRKKDLVNSVVNSKTAADIPLRKILFKPSKTYTDICRNWNDGGVVAKPGIATGSRS